MLHHPAQLADIVRTVRARGYATRPPDMEPRNSNTLAVPIFNTEGRVTASLGLTYFRSAFPTLAEAVDRHVPLLVETSREITVDLLRLAPHRDTGDRALDMDARRTAPEG